MAGILFIVWTDLLWVVVPTLSFYACVIARVPVLEALMAGTSTFNSFNLGTLCFLFLTTCVGEALLSWYLLHVSLRLGERVKLLMQGAIFAKITRLSPSARAENTAGYIVSLLAVDCQQLCTCLHQMPVPTIGLAFLPLLFYMMSRHVGWAPALCCAAWPIIAVLLAFPISGLQSHLWGRVTRARDARLKRVAAILSSIRVVKMYSWEDSYMDTVTKLRQREMTPVFRVNLLDGFVDTIYGASSSLMTGLLFGTLAILDPSRALNPALSFTCLYMLSLTDMVTINACQLLRSRSQVSL